MKYETKSVVLMYHALYEGGDTSSIDTEDLPYAVSKEDFISQLDCIDASRCGVYSPGNTPEIIITFDDGHQSNLDIAVPLLQERGLSAYFFITSGFVDSRPGFLSAHGVKELSNSTGMMVGSHGVTHQFFNDLSSDNALKELADSKALLESITNHPCESMSFPGGRYNQSTLEIMKSAGYKQWFGSDVGLVDASSVFAVNETLQDGLLTSMSGIQPIKRVAIRRTTQLDEYKRMIAPDRSYYRSHVRRGQAKKIMQRTLGNRLYYGLYKFASSR